MAGTKHSPVGGAAALVAAFIALGAPAARGQSLDGRPLRTEAADTLALGRHALELGAEWRQGVAPVPLLDPDVRGDLLRAPVVRYRAGLGRAEIAISGAAWQSFSPEGNAPDSDEVGDFSLWVKVHALRGTGSRPSLGVSFGAKMPNASDESGLGSDESDLFLQGLLSGGSDRHHWRVNLGLAILGDPRQAASQEDLLTYGFAGRHGGRHALIWEAWGRALGDDRRELDESQVRLGYVLTGERVAWDASVLSGIEPASGDLGVATGLTWSFGGEAPP